MGEAAKASEETFVKGQIGTTAKVLFEIYKDGINEGYSENYTRVLLKSEENLSGKIVTLKLTEEMLEI